MEGKKQINKYRNKIRKIKEMFNNIHIHVDYKIHIIGSSCVHLLIRIDRELETNWNQLGSVFHWNWDHDTKKKKVGLRKSYTFYLFACFSFLPVKSSASMVAQQGQCFFLSLCSRILSFIFHIESHIMVQNNFWTVAIEVKIRRGGKRPKKWTLELPFSHFCLYLPDSPFVRWKMCIFYQICFS